MKKTAAVWFLLELAILLQPLNAARLHAADWPMARGNAARSAAASESLKLPLASAWTYRAPAKPRPAWPRSERMRFDRAMQTVASAGIVVFGNSVDGTITALDLESGQAAWSFATEGPIRFAPALWRDQVYAVSDDGNLYVLKLSDGSLLWQHQGGKGHQAVLGNGAMISKWPARGGPVIADGVVYYAAGIWPSEGIFIHALNAETGEPLWSNTESGFFDMPQPHGGANAESGVAAQGYLVVAKDRLLVPTGRAVPACFNRLTGKFDYFHLQKYGQNGESLMMALGDVFFNGGLGFGLAEGQRRAKIGTGQLAAFENGVIRSFGHVLAQYQWGEEESKNKQGEVEIVQALRTTWSHDGLPQSASILTAGHQVVLGSDGQVSIFDTTQGKIVWEAPIEGTAYGLALANGNLLVSTDQGTIAAFAPESEQQPERSHSTGDNSEVVAANPSASTVAAPVATLDSGTAADEIVRRSGVMRGFCLDLACGDGSLARELAVRTELQIIAVDEDPENVRRARALLSAAGLYGTRVVVQHRDPNATGYPTYFADLIVSGRSIREGAESFARAEAKRLQRPFGGSICIGPPGKMKQTVRGPLAGAGNWTHQYANTANTTNSDDSLVAGRLGMLWFRDIDFEIPSRHGRAPAPLFQDGLLINAGMDGVIGVDAYNGRQLWHRSIPNLLRAYDGDELMGVSGTGSNLCIGGHSVFVRDGHRCLQLDVASGQPIGEFETPVGIQATDQGEATGPKGAAARDQVSVGDEANDQEGAKRNPWGYLAWSDGILFGSSANQEHVVTYRYVNRGGDMTKQLTESRTLFAIDPATGKYLWSYEATDSIRHNGIAIAAGRVFLIDRPLAHFDRIKKPKSKEHPTGKLVALDPRTGKVEWKNDDNIYGTMLAVSQQHNVILMSYQPTRFRLDSETGGRMAAFRTDSGARLWDIEAKYSARPMLSDRTIYTQDGAWDLLTGKPVPFALKKSYGCGILASSKKMLLFRSATLGYYDLTGAKKTENYGGIRPGCWINALPVGGIVLLPDATSGCNCSYLNKAWIALEPMNH
jgi:outer membrane protein assembly factor BamB